MTESKRPFYFKETVNSLVLLSGVLAMGCYFLRDGHIVGVSMLPPGIPDEASIALAHKLAAKRSGRIDGFEIWGGAFGHQVFGL